MDLSIHNDVSCGGDNVYVELNQGIISCKTENKVDFDRGINLSWTGPALGTCLERVFNVEQQHFNFRWWNGIKKVFHKYLFDFYTHQCLLL